MKSPPSSPTRRDDHNRRGNFSRATSARSRSSAFTLIEVVIAFAIFAILAVGVLACLIQSSKYAASNLAQGYAQTMAQGVIEEIVSVSPTLLADDTQATVGIKLAKLTGANHTTLENFQLPWSDSDTAFTDIGTTDLTDKGVLVDAAYIASSNTIRPQRFMRMRLNLRRVIEATSNNRIRIVLRYQWEAPDRKGANGAPVFLRGEIRTVRSTAQRF